MANALDRVKAAEAKYAAMGETAEKLESTLKEFKGEADLCYATMRELQREIKFRAEEDQKAERWAFWWLVLVVGTVAFTMAFLGNFLREGLCALLMLWGLGGEADANLSDACVLVCGAWENETYGGQGAWKERGCG